MDALTQLVSQASDFLWNVVLIRCFNTTCKSGE